MGSQLASPNPRDNINVRNGRAGGRCYLANPQTAAATAVAVNATLRQSPREPPSNHRSAAAGAGAAGAAGADVAVVAGEGGGNGGGGSWGGRTSTHTKYARRRSAFSYVLRSISYPTTVSQRSRYSLSICYGSCMALSSTVRRTYGLKGEGRRCIGERGASV